MVGGPDVKVATVDVESGDNMATLPVSRVHTSNSGDSAEKNNAANKEMELKNVLPKPLQRFVFSYINTIYIGICFSQKLYYLKMFYIYYI